MYSRVRASGLANGWPYQPSTTCGPETPRPRMKRPPERWSIVIAAIAVAAGVRADICTIAVPSLMLLGLRAPPRQRRQARRSRRPRPSRSSRSRAARPRRSRPRMPAGGPAPQ